MPQFSVIMPAYNREQLIECSINSVLAQTDSDWELIVVDDGSTDRTIDIVQSISDKRVRLIKQVNSGPGAARNRGALDATGHYLAFLDSDDLWFPWTLANYRSTIEQYKEPALVIGVNHAFHGDAGCLEPGVDEMRTRHAANYYAFSGHAELGNTSATVAKLDAVRKTDGFLEGLVNYEDIHLWMQLGIANGFVFLAGPPSAAYRMHSGSITRNMKRKYDGLAHCLVMHKTNRYPGGSDRYSDRARILSRFVRSTCDQCAKAGAFRYSVDLYLRSLRDQSSSRRWKFIFGFPLWMSIRFVQYLITKVGRRHDNEQSNESDIAGE